VFGVAQSAGLAVGQTPLALPQAKKPVASTKPQLFASELQDLAEPSALKLALAATQTLFTQPPPDDALVHWASHEQAAQFARGAPPWPPTVGIQSPLGPSRV
jgi:hypothetical protein